jgi:hypothetical protein
MLIGNLSFRGPMAVVAVAALFTGPVLSAQQVRTAEPAAASIVSLAPAPRPLGELLARNPNDAHFEHAPANYHVFSAATAGKDGGVETIVLNFADETSLTRIESRSKDFVLESGGTCQEGNSYQRGDSCSLLVRFNPQGAGHRLGYIEITHSAQAQPFYVGLTGNGYAPVVSFTPSEITTVAGTFESSAGTIKSATNLTVDGGDIIYIDDIGNDLIKEIDSSGTISTITPFFVTPASLAVDSFGIIYAASIPGAAYYFTVYLPSGTEIAFSPPYKPGTCTPSTPCAFFSVGMSDPAQINIDPNDDLFMEERTKGALEMPVASYASGAPLDLWYLSDSFAYNSGSAATFAVDAYGDLYTYYLPFDEDTCYLLEEPLYGAEGTDPTFTRVAGGEKCGYSGDGGQARGAEISSSVGQVAFDIAGNLYFTDTGNQRVRRIDASTGIISTIAGTGTAGYSGDKGPATSATLSSPTGLTVDSEGQVYILSNAPSAGPTQALRKVGILGYESFGGQLKGTSSAASVVTVANTGNDTLTLSVAGFFNGANPSNFAVDPNTTSCALTAGATLDAGTSCKIGFLFRPSGGGTFSANYVLQDNTVTNTNTIVLIGTGTLPLPTVLITSPPKGATVTSDTTVTFTATVTSSNAPAPTGTVTFKVNGTTIGSAVTLSSSSASISFKASATGTNTLQAVYSGDSNYATTSASETVTVDAARLSPGAVNFGNQPVGIKSLPTKVTLSNKGAVAVNIARISIAGTDEHDFAETNTCGKTVPAGESCFITVTFTPLAKGSRTASVSITDNGGGSPQKVSLAGKGT